jgi:hypothetical protein
VSKLNSAWTMILVAAVEFSAEAISSVVVLLQHPSVVERCTRR